MSGNNHKRKLAIMNPAPPQNIAARLTITAFTDKPPKLECGTDIVGALRLLGIGLAIVSNAVEQASKPPAGHADVMDKKREFLGPREG
jgi:hypothetical protein